MYHHSGMKEVCPGYPMPHGTYADGYDTQAILSPIGAHDTDSAPPLPTPPLNIVPTGIWVRWPFAQPLKQCSTVLETNVLAPADCPSASSCGKVTWTTLDKSWTGNEIGYCAGSGLFDVEIHNDTLYYHGGMPAKNWGQLYTFSPLERHHDVCGMLPNLRIIRFSDHDIMVSLNSYSNFVALDTAGSPGKNVLMHPEFIMSARGHPCPTMLPTNYLEATVLYKGPHVLTWPATTPVLVLRDAGSYQPNCSQLASVYLDEPRVISPSLRVLLSGPSFGYTEPHHAPRVCVPHSYVTSYAFPGHSWLTNALRTVVEVITDVILSLASTLVNSVTSAAAEINISYRLFEILLVALYSLWKFDSPWRAALPVVVYLAVVGVRR